MAQFDDGLFTNPTSGASAMSSLNELINAVQSGHSGASLPPDAADGFFYVKTNGALRQLTVYDGIGEQTVWQVNNTNGIATTPITDGLLTRVTNLEASVAALQSQVVRERIPVGGYIELLTPDNPATILGYGAWEQQWAGVTNVSAGSGFALGTTGGSANRALGVGNLPSHRHQVSNHSHWINSRTINTGGVSTGHTHYKTMNYFSIFAQAGGFQVLAYNGNIGGGFTTDGQSTNHHHSVTISGANTNGSSPWTTYVGSGSAFSIMQPYLCVNRWRRTA